jgi:purine-binding chemotaxis protein CheW
LSQPAQVDLHPVAPEFGNTPAAAAEHRQAAQVQAVDPQETDDEAAVNHIVFGLNGARYAVSIRSVLELDRLSPITPVPNTPEFILGVTNVRGDVVSVLDLRRLLGMPPLARPETGRLIQVRPTGAVVRSGVLVDSILGMRPVRTSRIAPDPAADASLEPVLDGVFEDNPEPLRVLNIEKLFETAQIRALLDVARS